jgi:hypothetical protein
VKITTQLHIRDQKRTDRQKFKMAPNKTGTKSTTPTGSASPGKQSVASNFSEVSLPDVTDDKSRAPSQMSDDFNDSPGPSQSKIGSVTSRSSMRGESVMSRTSSGRSASVFGLSPGSQFWKGLRCVLNGVMYIYHISLFIKVSIQQTEIQF